MSSYKPWNQKAKDPSESEDDDDDDLDFDDGDDDFDTSNSKSNSISTSNKFSSSRPMTVTKPTGISPVKSTSNMNPDSIIKMLLSEKSRAIGVTNTELTEDMIATLIEKAQDVITG